MEALLKKHAEKFRFLLVGGANTVIDFAILFLGTNLGLPAVAANYISTSIALLFSFFANKSFTFKNTSTSSGRQFIAFLVVTLIGLWVLQPIVIHFSTLALSEAGLSAALTLFVAKCLATVISLVWNYLLYAKFVFKRSTV